MGDTPPLPPPPPADPAAARTMREIADATDRASVAADGYATRMAGVNKAIESLESTFESFKKAIADIGLQQATKQFYDLIDGTASLRKNFGDLSAESDATQDKISLMAQSISDAESELRSYIQTQAAVQKAQFEYNKAIAEEAEISRKLSDARYDADAYLSEQEQLLNKLTIAQDRLTAAKRGAEGTYGEEERALTAAQNELDLFNLRNASIEELLRRSRELNTTELGKDLDKKKAEERAKKAKAEEAAANLPLERYEKSKLESLEKVNNYMDSFLGKLTSSAERSNILGSAFLAMQQSIDGTGFQIGKLFTNISDGLMKSLLDPEKAANRFFNLINDKLIKSTLEFDKSLAQIGKSTGGFRKEFEDVAIKMGGVNFMPLTELGINLEKYSQAYASLSKSIGNFNNLLGSQRKLLTDSAASLEVLGVSADTYGKLVSVFMSSMNKSLEGSRQMMEQLTKDAIGLGQSVATYTQNFQTALSKISGYGREAITIFKELNALAMSTNDLVTTSDLLNISDKFKDFDSAADAVSKLNAVMGGVSVNILDMMKADPAEQIMMIKRAAGESGLEFEKLNIGYKRLLAEYFGGDINKAAAFFKADIQEANNLLNKAAATEEEIAKRKEQNVAFQDKLNALTDNMRVMLTPILGIANSIIGAMSKLFNFPGGPLIATIGMIAGAFALMMASIRRVTTVIMEKIEAINAARAAAAAETTSVVEGSSAEVVAIERVRAAEERLAETRRRTAGAGGGGSGGGGGTPFFSGGMKTAIGGAAGLLAVMGASYGLKQLSEHYETERIKEREQFISNLKINEMKAEKELLGQYHVPAPLPEPTGGTAEDILFITGDDGKTVKESYKLSTGDRMLPVGKDGGPLQTVFNPTTNQSVANFNETKNEVATASNVGGGVREGDKVNISNTTNNTQAAAANAEKPPSSITEAQRTRNTINVTAYLTLDGQNMKLVTDRVSENLTSKAPS